MSATIKDLQDWYNEGSITKAEYFARVAELCLENNPDGLARSMGPALGDEFVRWVYDGFDNDVPAEAFLWIDSSGATPPSRPEIAIRLREWISERRSREA